MASQARKQRIEAELQRVLAELIAREVKDPRVGSLTITAVKVAADMGVARVAFVPFGTAREAAHDPQQVQQVQQGLARAAGYLRGEVGRRLGLRHAPRLEFEYDVSIERADRLSRLIDAAVRGDGDPS